ncbi:phosphatase PAP2 family protein [Panacibacter ginsenosidivorans]|uniref:Phosphatase PAP2 family protein n=1 Tax=Panacibacter ginsenosidivorans TaxID=1813871 RepID=A0A5B8V582_9BACT|nr:phosphatase PAP2 family protein [Panacibacter ginsenosidivorans]QEC65871.1 phosphatase PAP2 family protein [Panacibacter ginsenosidivorans]
MLLLDTSVSAWSQFFENIKLWDQWLFIKINTVWTNDFLNSVYPWWRDSNTWIPLYLFLALFAFINFGWRVWPWVIFFIITVALTDQLSSNLIKNFIQRPRPCNDEDFMGNVNALLGHCSGGYSFPSSHATNHFGMACFIYFTMKQYFKKWGYLFFVWAATIAYGQVYIGIHYPLDILGGAVIGSLVGMMTASVFNRRIGLPELKIYSQSSVVNSE